MTRQKKVKRGRAGRSRPGTAVARRGITRSRVRTVILGTLGAAALSVMGLLVHLILTGPPGAGPKGLSGQGSESADVSWPEDDTVRLIIEGMTERREVDFADLDDFVPERREPQWQASKVAYTAQDGPVMAVVIDDMGMVAEAQARLGRMPAPLTLAYLPYAPDLPIVTRAARAAGHELMVHLPMEPKRRTADPGPGALLSTLDQAEFDRRLAHNLSRFDGFVGVNNHMGSALTEDPSRMVRVMAALKREGYLFLDSLTSPNTVGPRAAQATGVPWLSRDIFLDNERDPARIRTQLDRAEALARANGFAVAIGHPYPETFDVLLVWSRGLSDRGVQLAPISVVMARKLASQQASISADRVTPSGQSSLSAADRLQRD